MGKFGLFLKPIPHDKVYELCTTVSFQVSDALYDVPAGFTTDGASIPRFAWVTTGTPYDPRHIRAAVFHDYLYQSGFEPRKWADQAFRSMLREDGVSAYQSWKMYWALRVGGWWAWRKYRRQRAVVMEYNIICKDTSGKLAPFEVPEPVYLYIRQLETAIRFPEVSRLQEAYPDRFAGIKRQVGLAALAQKVVGTGDEFRGRNG